jgi:hypothetical protein
VGKPEGKKPLGTPRHKEAQFHFPYVFTVRYIISEAVREIYLYFTSIYIADDVSEHPVFTVFLRKTLNCSVIKSRWY